MGQIEKWLAELPENSERQRPLACTVQATGDDRESPKVDPRKRLTSCVTNVFLKSFPSQVDMSANIMRSKGYDSIISIIIYLNLMI